MFFNIITINNINYYFLVVNTKDLVSFRYSSARTKVSGVVFG